jgi:hypothetical protein
MDLPAGDCGHNACLAGIGIRHKTGYEIKHHAPGENQKEPGEDVFCGLIAALQKLNHEWRAPEIYALRSLIINGAGV